MQVRWVATSPCGQVRKRTSADEKTEHVLNTCYNLFSHCYSLIELFFFVSCHRVVCKGRWGIKRPSRGLCPGCSGCFAISVTAGQALSAEVSIFQSFI